jgi:uncharacterized protein (DUF4415 family)
MNPKHTEGIEMQMEGIEMQKEYDFSEAKPNPYFQKLRKQTPVRIDTDAAEYLKKQAGETGKAYQKVINRCVSGYAVGK